MDKDNSNFFLKFIQVHTLHSRLLIATTSIALLIWGLHLGETFWGHFLAEVGSGGFVAALVAIIFEPTIAKVIDSFREMAVSRLSADISNVVKSEGNEVKRYVREIQSSIYSNDIRHSVFNMGVTGVGSGDLVDDEFFQSQNHLDIFLKDGHTFFEKREQIIRARLLDPRKTTRIAILHPDFQHIKAVANMDANKNANAQAEDCRKAIKTLQGIAKDGKEKGDNQVSIRTKFIGIRLVPTWNGFLGDKSGYVYLYFTRPYRGDLIRLSFDKIEQENKGIYDLMKKEVDDILRDPIDEKLNLWKYKLT